MFNNNKDFYPTPEYLFNQLVGRDPISGSVLEPSAGKGDLIKHIKNKSRYANLEIDAVESDANLANVLLQNEVDVVWNDFLTYETYKEYDYIIMNPPFSNGVDHLLKAFELAENQVSNCFIYAILNKQTIKNDYSNKRKVLLDKLDRYNAKIDYVKEGFSRSERKTDVEVALIKVHVTKSESAKKTYQDNISEIINSLSGSDDELETVLSTYVKSNQVNVRLSEIERLVLEYETSSKLVKEAYFKEKEKQRFLNYIYEVNKSNSLRYIVSNDVEIKDVNQELSRLRRGYWEMILDTRDFRKLLTNEAIQKLNRQLAMAEKMEVNLTNIKMLLTALGANREDILIDSIVSIFEKITKYHMNQYSTNVHYYNGWKTNNAYKINKKIIIPIQYSYFDSWDFKENYDALTYQIKQWIDDIIKAFQLLDSGISSELDYIGNNEFGNELLKFKMFKNGNIHIWFKDLDLLNQLNYLCGKHFNWLPSDEEVRTNKKAREYVIKEFGSDVNPIKKLAV